MRPLFLVAALFALPACIRTMYNRAGFTGGYYETPTGQRNTVKVWFEGNAFISAGTVETYALYRCAEYAYEHNAPYFEILDSSLTFEEGTMDFTGDGSGTPYKKYTAWAIIQLLGKEPKASVGNVYETAWVLQDAAPYIRRPLFPEAHRACCLIP